MHNLTPTVDLREATTLEEGHANDDPCFVPHKWGNAIYAYLVVKMATE